MILVEASLLRLQKKRRVWSRQVSKSKALKFARHRRGRGKEHVNMSRREFPWTKGIRDHTRRTKELGWESDSMIITLHSPFVKIRRINEPGTSEVPVLLSFSEGVPYQKYILIPVLQV